MPKEVIVRLTPEQTAEWLRGDPVDWMEGLTDDDKRRRYAEHVMAMERATFASAQVFLHELGRESPQTQARLMELTQAAKSGNQRARSLLLEMLLQLMRQGMKVGAV